MVLMDQRILGALILLLLVGLVIVKRLATGSIFDKPKCNSFIKLVNIFNLSFLLVVNPAAALLLMTGRLATGDPAHASVGRLSVTLEAAGLALYVAGFLLMAWALTRLGGNYQLGGVIPRESDKMVVDGPYRLVRHPMCTAALSISLGLACLMRSLAFLWVFGIYAVLIGLLIPLEERGLRQAYGDQYLSLQRKTSKLIPFVF